MAKKRDQLEEALAITGESSVVVCFQDMAGEADLHTSWAPVETGTIDDLPDWEFNDDFGGLEGCPMIAFGPKYIYISVQYDGLEWVMPIPRGPGSVGDIIPWPGG